MTPVLDLPDLPWTTFRRASKAIASREQAAFCALPVRLPLGALSERERVMNGGRKLAG